MIRSTSTRNRTAIDNRMYKKGRDDEDLLRGHVNPREDRRSQVLRRVPDLDRVLASLA